MRYTLEKNFFFTMSIFLSVIIIIGFWPSYFSPFLERKEIFSSIPLNVIHIHAATFIGWFLLLIIQSVLVKMKNLKFHMILGKSTALWGFLIVSSGLVVATWSMYNAISGGRYKSIYPFLGELGVYLQIIFFGFFLYWAYRKRFQADFHKRYILLASLSIMAPATDRMHHLIGLWSLEIMLLFFIAALIGYDLYTIKHIHKANRLGIVFLCISTFLISFGFKVRFLLLQ